MTNRVLICFFFFSSRRRHTRLQGDWSSDVCSSDLSAVRLSVTLPDDGERLEIVSVLIRVDLDGYAFRSEERRVGKEGRSRWSPYHLKKKKNKKASNTEM